MQDEVRDAVQVIFLFGGKHRLFRRRSVARRVGGLRPAVAGHFVNGAVETLDKLRTPPVYEDKYGERYRKAEHAEQAVVSENGVQVKMFE